MRSNYLRKAVKLTKLRDAAPNSFETSSGRLCMVRRCSRPSRTWLGMAARSTTCAALARVLWLRGFVDQGVARAQASFEGAQAMHHKPTLCWVTHYGAFPFALIMRDFVAAGRAMAMLRDAATRDRKSVV